MFLLFAIGMTANAQKFALIDMEYILKNMIFHRRKRQKEDTCPFFRGSGLL